MERREFLQVFGAALGAALLARPLAAAAAACTTRALVLEAAECELLEAICARILPPVGGVSTREAGCVNFIDKLLAHEEQALAPAYRAGLAALDALARSRLARDFAALDAAQQVSLLEQLEDGKLEPWPAAAGAQAALFGTLRLHTLLGFLAAPAFGGNRDGAGWKAVGHVGHLHGAGGVSDDQVTGASP
jgi:gluconate 2-dehydrogenase gamma chain